MYWDVNNLYGQAMSQKLPLDGFKWIKKTSTFTPKFIQSYNDEMMTATKEIFLKIDPKKMCSDLPFLPERMKMDK